jgi:transcription elongation factor Elf1
MATKSKTTFGVTCPHCHDTDAVVSIDLNEVGTIRCSACDTEFTATEARDLAAAELARWEKVVAWVAMAKDLAG